MAKSTPEDLMDSIINNIKGLDGMNVQFNTSVTCIPTGIDLLDYIMGGGVPLGKLSTITGQPGGGKSLPVSAKVLTPSGWKLMKDIAVGDVVCTVNCGTSRVVGVYPQGKLQTYTVTFTNGAVCRCSEDHLWAVRRDKKRKWRVKSLKALIDGKILDSKGKPSVMVPSTGIVAFFQEKDELPIAPTLIGDYVCGGEMVGWAPYTEDERNKILEDLGIKDLKIEEMFIPDLYKFASLSNRLGLLDGLLDASSKRVRNYDVFKCKSKKLAQDVYELVYSLGGYTKTEESKGKYSLKINIPFSTMFGFYQKPLTDEWTSDRANPDIKIASIEKGEVEECQCIKIDSDSGLFITDDYVVTHNTTVAAQYIVGFQKYHPESLAFYIDTEQGLSKERLVQLGCNPKRTALISQGLTMETVFKVINKILSDKITAKKKDIPYIIIWDSESATPTDKAMEAEDPSSIMGEHARNFQFILNKMIPNIAACNTSLVVISQLRQNIVMDRYAPKKADLTFGGVQKITGGSAAEFLPFQLAFIRSKGRTGPECKNENCIPVIGQANEIYFKKNKNFTPEIPIELVIDYDTGYSDFWSKERLLRTNKCFKGAAWQTLDGCDVKHHRAEVKDKYDTDPVFKEAFDKLYEEKKKELLSIKSTKKKKESEGGLTAEDEKLLEALGTGNADEIDVNFDFSDPNEE